MAVTVGTIQAIATLKDEMSPKLKTVTAALGTATAGIAAMTKRGSDVQRIATSFDRLATAAGQSGAAILAATKGATQGLVSEYAIMEAVQQGAPAWA